MRRGIIELRADRDDAGFLLALIAESSGGVWPAVWKALASENESVEASGMHQS